MTTLPVFSRTTVKEDEDAMYAVCRACPLSKTWHQTQCQQVPIVRYDREGVITDSLDPVELLVVGDPPSAADNAAGKYWSDKEGKKILSAVKRSDAESFAVIPAIRCYPTAEVDHFVLKKKYRNARQQDKVSGRDMAMSAVPHCKVFVDNARRILRPRRTLAIGPVATKALMDDQNIIKLRSTPLHRHRGLQKVSKNEGTIVTWDRAYVKVDKWAARDMTRDIEEKLPNIRNTSYSTPRGDHRTITQHTLDTVGKVRKFVKWCLTSTHFRKDDFICLDFETDGLGLNTETNRLLNVGFSFRNSENVAYVIPLSHPETPFTVEGMAVVRKLLRKLFRGKGAKWFAFVAHNAQFETAMVKLFFDVWLGDDGDKPCLDSKLLAYALNENRNKTGINHPYSLETLAREYLGWRWYEETGIKLKRASLSGESLAKVNQYVGFDAVVTARLVNTLMEQMEEEGSLAQAMNLAVHLYSEAIKYTVDMQLTGQRIDVPLLQLLRGPDSSIGPRLEEIRAEFQSHKAVRKALRILNNRGSKKAGVSGNAPKFQTTARANATWFELQSDVHRKVLFGEVLKLPGATESVDKKFQETYKNVPLVALFQEHQALSTLTGLFLKPIAEFLQGNGDGRLHPTFNLTKTTSGRLSASEPNTQGVPRGNTKDKKQIKSLYAVPPGMVMVQLDFSQAEARWLGILSKDKNLARLYTRAAALKGALRADPHNKDLQKAVMIQGDLHMTTAISMYKLDPESIIDPETFKLTEFAALKRQLAKTICFGLIYGKHPKSLAKDLGISEEESYEAVEKWMGQFPEAGDWLSNVDDTIADTCVSISPFGRWRRLPEAAASDMSVRNRAKRQARNTPIQSAASDFCIYAACQLRKALRAHPDPRLREKTKLINTVHDSLGAEMPAEADVVLEYMSLATGIFTNPDLILETFEVKTTVPLEVDFSVGANWGAVQDCDKNLEDVTRCLWDANVLTKQPTGTILKDLVGKGLLYNEVHAK